MRYLAAPILEDLSNKMVLLSGPRQCGKTTFAKWLLSKYERGEYFNWDQPKDRKRINQQDWSENADLVVLDEVHKKKSWKNFVKGTYDTRPKNMQFLVTGSARLEMFQKSGDSMLGRFNSWRMHPFCLKEDPLHLSPSERFDRFLSHGNFPVPYLANDSREIQRWRKQRWSLLLREDLRDFENVKDLQSIELLAELLKSHAAGMLSYANLAEDVEVAPKTIKHWVGILENLYLIFLIKPYTLSVKRALSKTPKLYFIDSGDLIESPIGSQVENLVALNLLKRVQFIEDAYGDKIDLQYIRDKEGREVDFVITLNRKAVALIEVKTQPQEPDASLIHFKSKLKIDLTIQLHSDYRVREKVKNGIRMLSIHEFFSSEISERRFWEK